MTKAAPLVLYRASCASTTHGEHLVAGVWAGLYQKSAANFEQVQLNVEMSTLNLLKLLKQPRSPYSPPARRSKSLKRAEELSVLRIFSCCVIMK